MRDFFVLFSLDKQRVFIAVLFTLCTLEGEKLKLVQSKNYSVKEGIQCKPLVKAYSSAPVPLALSLSLLKKRY